MAVLEVPVSKERPDPVSDVEEAEEEEEEELPEEAAGGAERLVAA